MSGTGFAEAAAQIRGQHELAGSSPLQGQTSEDVGRQAQAAGAEVTGVNVEELFAFIRQLQERVEAVEAERAQERKGTSPGIVAKAEQILADLTHRHGALGQASVLGDAVDKAARLVEAAKAADDSGDGTAVTSLAGALGKHLSRVASAASSADISYARQLVEEDLPEIVADLKPRPSVVQGDVLSRSDAKVPRKLYAPV
jgi:hypothetical protein